MKDVKELCTELSAEEMQKVEGGIGLLLRTIITILSGNIPVYAY